jgi:signal transduction histidine kinase
MGISAADTVDGWLGGLVTTVSLKPELARSLLIGGIPTSRLPWYLGLLAISTAVAALAIVQWQRARELSRLRDRFVANVSHELRTPLTQISMLGETMLLDRHRSAEEGRRYLSVIVRESRRLTHLVESVLRFSRAEAAAPGLRIERRDIVPDIRDTVEAFAPLAAAATARIEMSAPRSAESYADAGAVRQILLNLLDNAVKYGPPGQTTRVAVQPSANEILVSVEDEGPGISVADRDRVFEPFTRLDHHGQPNVAGAGIGLSVVRDLVSAHGGRIWITEPRQASARGVGTSITFTLRAVEAE